MKIWVIFLRNSLKEYISNHKNLIFKIFNGLVDIRKSNNSSNTYLKFYLI